MDNHRLAILNYVRDQLEDLRDDETLPLNVERIWRRAVDPVNTPDEHLPSIFYGYGGFVLNNRSVGSGYQGETISLVVNAIVNHLLDPMGNVVDGEDIITRAAKIHYGIQLIVDGLRTMTDEGGFASISPTMDFRLQSGETEFQGISDREFISFNIEIDWFYKL